MSIGDCPSRPRPTRPARPAAHALRAAAAWWLLTAAVQAAQATAAATVQAPAQAGFYRRASQCAAVLKSDVERRSAQPAAAQAQRARLLQETEAAFAFVGEAYRRGLRKPEADAMLDAASREQAGWRDAQRQTLLQACLGEARVLLDEANAVERLLVRRTARHRVDKLLAPDPPR